MAWCDPGVSGAERRIEAYGDSREAVLPPCLRMPERARLYLSTMTWAWSGRLALREVDLEWRAVEGEVVALDVTRSLYLGVNSSGRILWEALAHGATRAGLVRALLDAYALDGATAERDTDAFLAALDRGGLLDRETTAPSRGGAAAG